MFSILDLRSRSHTPSIPQVFYPPGTTAGSLSARPFHIYDESFIKLLGDNPSLTLLSETDSDPLFHEAAVWHPPTDSMFFVQNAGAPAAGTGLNKSSIVERIMLSDAEAAAAAAATGGPGKSGSNSSAQIDVEVVDSQPQVINPNGGTNWRGQIVFAGEGMGNKTASALYAMDPVEYNTTVLLNNYMGRQFNSLNDVAVHPNGWIYFTDVDYGALQDFRAKVNIRKQVYRFNPDSGVVQAVSDSTPRPNGELESVRRS
jgi:gluconolactonase